MPDLLATVEGSISDLAFAVRTTALAGRNPLVAPGGVHVVLGRA